MQKTTILQYGAEIKWELDLTQISGSLKKWAGTWFYAEKGNAFRVLLE